MWPEECISCPIYGGAGLGEAPLPDQTVPPPPSGEEIIRPYDPSDPELMPLSPAEGAAPGPAPPPTSGDQEAPDDQARFDEQGRRRYRGPSHKQRRAEMSRSPIETPVNSNNSLPEWQLAPLPDGARNALAHEAGESWPPAGRQAASQIAPVVRKVRR